MSGYINKLREGQMIAITRKKFTIDEYHRLGDLGFFKEDDRVELIRGDIIEMPAKKTPHSVCNTLLVKQLVLLLGNLATVRGKEPIILPSDSEPQPDVAIVKNKQDNYLSSHPQPEDIVLVIEICDSSLKYDRETKLSLYAGDKISDYWLFNLIDNQLEMYSEPYQNQQGKMAYRFKRIVLPNEVVQIPCFPDLSLDLATIFPLSPQ
jgi:Uma2 family endonuclease